MQRIGSDTQSLIRDLLWLIPLIIYGSLSTIYFLLPPLFGLFTALLVINKAERYLPLVLAYFLFFEADHGFFLLSSWVFLFLFFRFVVPVMEDNLICRPCIIVLSVALGYAGLFLFLSLIHFLLGLDPLSWSWLLLFYFVAVEAMLAVVLL
ncbi:MAG: hypothetical protein AB7E49_05235 [Campylobacterales bacterium]